MRRGFTLVELLIVIAIISTIAAIVIPAIDTASRQGRVLAEGILQRYEYIPSGDRPDLRATVIYFNDGTSFVMKGDHYSIVFPPGTRIRIYGSQSNYRIEKVAEAR